MPGVVLKCLAIRSSTERSSSKQMDRSRNNGRQKSEVSSSFYFLCPGEIFAERNCISETSEKHLWRRSHLFDKHPEPAVTAQGIEVMVVADHDQVPDVRVASLFQPIKGLISLT